MSVRNPLLWWCAAINTGSGSTLPDLSGNGYDGTMSSVSRATDGGKDTLSFDRTANSVISNVSVPSLGETRGVTISVWIKPSSLGNFYGVCGQGAGGLTLTVGGVLMADGSMKWFRTHHSSKEIITPAAGIVVGNWAHVVYRTFVTGTGARDDVWVNGELVTEDSSAGLASTDVGFALGRAAPTTTSYDFSGLADDLRVFDYSIGEDDIANLASGIGYTPPSGGGSTVRIPNIRGGADQ